MNTEVISPSRIKNVPIIVVNLPPILRFNVPPTGSENRKADISTAMTTVED